MATSLRCVWVLGALCAAVCVAAAPPCLYNATVQLRSQERVVWQADAFVCSAALRLAAPSDVWRDSHYEVHGVSALPLFSALTGLIDNITIVVRDCAVSDADGGANMNGTFTVVKLTAAVVRGVTVAFVNVSLVRRCLCSRWSTWCT